MPIPGKVIFGMHLSEDRPIRYEEVRNITDENIQLKYLKKRLENFLIDQVNPIGDKKISAPFPLTVLTCIASETLGRIIEPVALYEKDEKTKREIPKIVSVKIYDKLDPKLTRPLTKKLKEEMQKIWPDDNIQNISSYSTLFHSYLRTSFVHGYRAKNVFLTEEISSWIFEEGSLYINPYWFWSAFKEVFEKCFAEIFNVSERNNPVRKNALRYFDQLINE